MSHLTSSSADTSAGPVSWQITPPQCTSDVKQPQHAFGRVQAISSLVDGSGSVVQLNDKGLLAPMRVRLNFLEA